MAATTIQILPRSKRARQGNPTITEWCPACRERVIPMREGLCGWCDTPVTRDAKQHAAQAPPPRPRVRPSKQRIVTWLAEHDPATTRTINVELDLAYRTATKYVGELRTAGILERVRNPDDARCWLYTVRGNPR